MFSLFKKRCFEPNFPIVELSASPDQVLNVLSSLSSVVKNEEVTETGIDFEYIAENHETRICVGFSSDKVSYVNYLSEKFNSNDKQKALKLDWFVNHYGPAKEFDKPNNTGYMLFFHNPKRKLTIVFGLHMGPIRINNHANA